MLFKCEFTLYSLNYLNATSSDFFFDEHQKKKIAKWKSVNIVELISRLPLKEEDNYVCVDLLTI